MALIDLTGQKFGKLIVIKRTEKPEGSKCREAFWLCQCECGKQIVSRGANLRNGNTKSCGCLQKETVSKMRFKDLKGKRFGKLLVIKQSNKNTKNGKSYWDCLCDCGQNVLGVLSSNLTTGKTTSCGCSRIIDITNQFFGSYQAICRLDIKSNNGSYYWKIRCIHCGDEREIPVDRLKKELMICHCQKEKGFSNYEKIIADILKENNIHFITEKTFIDLKNPKTNKNLRCDFYVDNSYIIEVDGEQHFKESGGMFNKYSLDERKELDQIKNNWCKKNNIPIIRIPYYEIIKNNIELKDLLPSFSKYLL